ncbi:MAG: DUF1989 domain-containing protein [Pseudomonadota bacterium]
MLNAAGDTILDRRRYQGLDQPAICDREVIWGRAEHLTVSAGAIISITNVDGGAPVWVSGLMPTARTYSIRGLDLAYVPDHVIDDTCFDSREMAALVSRRDGALSDGRAATIFDSTTEPGEMYVTKALQDQTLFVIAPITKGFVEGGGGSRFSVRVTPPATLSADKLLPDPLGRVVDEFRIDRATARSYQLKKGQFVQIMDVEGQQCSDFMAMRSAALDAGMERYIDSTVSRTMARSAYPQPGLADKFYDQDMKPLLAVRQDTVGRHDTFALACTARGYEERGFLGHVNCSDNISDVFEPYGIHRRRAWPAINFFFNSWINWQEHVIAADEAWSRPGDYVCMQALTDLVCVSTACPDDVDPINGWNPTDIHVRIYEEDTPITHSISWRAQPDDVGKLTRQSAFHPRTSALTSNFRPARDIWVPNQYDGTGAIAEYWACRNSATLQDMSGLRKFDIFGPDAEALLQHCMTRNVSKLSQHRGFYSLICDERGSVLDDGTLFRVEPAVFRWCCGSDNSALHLREQAEKLGLKVQIRSLGAKMPNLALQGPKSREILSEIAFTQPHRPALENLKWFGFTIARLRDRDGPIFQLCRTGFTGELGYEIFCDENDALEIWDGLMEVGAKHGLVPMGGDALEMLRIEAGLMMAGHEFGPDCDALEAGLSFAVDFKKEAFLGRDALARNAGAPRRKLVGLLFSGTEPPIHGDRIFDGREQVGVVTSACSSPQLGHAIAMARIAVENADEGVVLEVGKLDGHMKRLPCTVTSIPFIDPKREKARS